LEHCKKVVLDLKLVLIWICAVEEESLDGYFHIHVGFKLDEDKPDVDCGKSDPFRVVQENMNYQGNLEMGIYKSDRPMIRYLGKQQQAKEPICFTSPGFPTFDLKKRFAQYVTDRNKMLDFIRIKSDKYTTADEKKARIREIMFNSYYNNVQIIDRTLEDCADDDERASKPTAVMCLVIYPRGRKEFIKHGTIDGKVPSKEELEKWADWWDVYPEVRIWINSLEDVTNVWIHGVTNIGKSYNTIWFMEDKGIKCFEYPKVTGNTKPQFQYWGNGLFNINVCDEANFCSYFIEEQLKRWLDGRKGQVLSGNFVRKLKRDDKLPNLFIANYKIEEVFEKLGKPIVDSIKRRFLQIHAFDWRTPIKDEQVFGDFGHYDLRDCTIEDWSKNPDGTDYQEPASQPAIPSRITDDLLEPGITLEQILSEERVGVWLDGSQAPIHLASPTPPSPPRPPKYYPTTYSSLSFLEDYAEVARADPWAATEPEQSQILLTPPPPPHPTDDSLPDLWSLSKHAKK
jgi:hypothetical protein